MKRLAIFHGWFWVVPLLLATTACEKEEDIYGVFYLDIVTCHHHDGNTYFTHQATDSAPMDTLYPTETPNESLTAEGVRVLLQYKPLESLGENRERIEIQALSAIHFDTLRLVSHEQLAQLPNDTLYLQSIWKTGDFLNLRYRIDYHSRPHGIRLVADESTLESDTLKVELRHSRNDDPEGHWTNLYSSFNIEAYRSRPYTTLQVYVNQVNFDYKYYYFKLH
ncbi:NigD-like protein [Barnesiella sp. An55]|uniref:NigD-like protein n=1 Tax=Barnesiella sp. An55 TaxID=1965646 RepID=UPI000B36BCE6|nr:NigD-like protein [Barnesiella sp. An55]OUN73956.1 hypothetical protein B5G10_02705 [Barnesiella sp. An55]HIZ26912.1 NigD-like protein [Candidatus Barnesiella merdipullorum]